MTDNHKLVLLVEDEPLLANLLRQRLEKEGMKLILARDGEEALKTLRETKPDLILLDIILPKISGFELMETLKADPQFEQAPIMIISNLGQESDIARGRALGAVQYFVKAKVSIEELVEEVRSFLKISNNNSKLG
jgi:DNA-binding response OmpR family regulator